MNEIPSILSDDEEVLKEKFSISSLSKRENEELNFKDLSNIDTFSPKNRSPLNNSIAYRLNNLEKLLDIELYHNVIRFKLPFFQSSQQEELPIYIEDKTIDTIDNGGTIIIKEDHIISINNDVKDLRLSKMNDKEAALYYENRRNELLKGFSSKNYEKPLIKTGNYKDFIVFNPKNQQKNKKSMKKPKIEEKKLPMRTLKKSVSGYVKTPTASLRKPQSDVKIIENYNINSQTTTTEASESLKNPKNQLKSEKTIISSKKHILYKHPSQIISTKKKISVVSIDLRKMKKNIFFLAPLQKKENNRVKRVSRNCSLILEENLRKMEDLNKSRSFSFSSKPDMKNC